MPLHHRTVAVAAIASASLLSAAACSSSSPATSSPQSSSSGAAAAGSLKGKSFTVFAVWTGGEQAAFQAVLTAFDNQTGATGQYTPLTGGDLPAVLGTKIAGGTPPDVAILPQPFLISQYASSGNLKAAGPAVQAAVRANYSSEWASLGSSGGTLYGVPADASDKSTMWYSAKAFSDAGIKSTPATWQDLIKDGQTLAASGIQVPISVGGGDGWTLTDWFENVYIRTAGVAMYDKLTHHQIPWTDPSVAVALNALKQIWGDRALIGSPSAVLTVPFPSSVDNVFKASPTSAIVYEASFVATTITSDKDPAKVGTDAKFFPFPSVNGSKPVLEVGGDFAVAFTANPAAQPFLAYLASPAAAKILVSYPGSGFLSANRNLPAAAFPDSTSAQLAQQLVGAGNNFRFDMSDQAPSLFGGTPNKGEWADLQAFLVNGNVAQAQKQLEKDASAVKWS